MQYAEARISLMPPADNVTYINNDQRYSVDSEDSVDMKSAK